MKVLVQTKNQGQVEITIKDFSKRRGSRVTGIDQKGNLVHGIVIRLL